MIDGEAMLRWFNLSFEVNRLELGRACGCTCTATYRQPAGPEVTAIGSTHDAALRSLAVLLDPHAAAMWPPEVTP